MILLVFAWLPLAGPLWPFPTMENAAKGLEEWQSVVDKANAGISQLEIDKKSEAAKEIQKHIETVPTVRELYMTWMGKWVLKLVSLVFGILSVVYAIGEFKGWRGG